MRITSPVRGRIAGLGLALLSGLTLLATCAKPAAPARLTYVATIPPLGMILSEVAGDRAQVRVLLAAGASPHTYEPRPSDIRSTGEATALFWVDGLVDGWAAGLGGERKVQVFALVPPELKLTLPEHRHGITGGSPPDQPGEPDDLPAAKAGAKEDAVPDPHFWTSPRVVQALLPELVNELSRLDPAGTAEYQANADRFAAELTALDQELQQILAPVRGQHLLLLHPSMQYLMRDYGLELAAAIEPSPGQEASPQYLAELTELVHRLGIRAVFSEPQLANGPPQTIARETGLRLYQLDPLGGAPGRTHYGDLLRYNAQLIAQALAG